jgi:hypothetical protein
MGSAPHCLFRFIGSNTARCSSEQLPIDVTFRILQRDKLLSLRIPFQRRAKSTAASYSKILTQKITKGNLKQNSIRTKHSKRKKRTKEKQMEKQFSKHPTTGQKVLEK